VLAALAGAEIEVYRCRLTTGLEGVGVGGNGASGVVSNSLIRVIESGTQEDGLRAYSGGELAASNVTLIGSGNPTAGAVAEQTVAGVASLSVDSSVVRGFANSFRATQSGGGATAGAVVSWSSWDTPPTQSGGASVAQGAGNLAPALDPRFVNAASGDYRLRFDSPLVDAASAGPGVGPDLAGLPRYVDGTPPFTGPRRDIGAFEYQRAAPDTIASGPATGSIGESLPLTAQGSSDPDPGETLTYLWSFDDGTTATGIHATHSWSSPGTHTATVTASDPTGQSDSAVVAVQVKAAGGGGADTIAPQLTSGRMLRKRFRVGAKATPGSAARGSAFLFTLSERATVRIRIERAAAGRRSAGRCVKPRRRLAQARRCRRYVLVGTLTRRDLAAGRQRVAFSGRVGKRRLAAGRHRALLSATDAVGNRSRPVRLEFRIVRR
jgi:PKD domain